MVKGKRGVRFSPTLLAFSVQQSCMSPAGYRNLRAACPVLPSEATVDAYKCTGDLTDGGGVPDLLQSRLLARLTRNNTASAPTGYLIHDELRIACGIAYRVRG
jgi:hypothetical protein